MSLFTNSGTDGSVSYYFDNPTISDSFDACIQACTSYNTQILSNGAANPMPCFGAWFNANRTTSLYSNNCYLYTMAQNNFTEADLLVQSGGLTAMAIMVSWKNDTFVGSYLSDNGDWSGGVTSIGNII